MSLPGRGLLLISSQCLRLDCVHKAATKIYFFCRVTMLLKHFSMAQTLEAWLCKPRWTLEDGIDKT